jgi:hypothetical protein
MNKFQNGNKVTFKIGNLILSGIVICVINSQSWTKDSNNNPVKIDSYTYFVNTIVGGCDVEEKNILNLTNI